MCVARSIASEHKVSAAAIIAAITSRSITAVRGAGKSLIISINMG